MDIGQIRRDLIEVVKPAAPEFNWYPYLPFAPMLPYIALAAGADYRSDTLTFSTRVYPVTLNFDLGFVTSGDADDVQQQLDLFLSNGNDESVVDRLYADRTLGGTVTGVLVTGARLVSSGDVNASRFAAVISISVETSSS